VSRMWFSTSCQKPLGLIAHFVDEVNRQRGGPPWRARPRYAF
jgi:hypothetical protein